MLVSLTESGKKAHEHHRKFHESMIRAVIHDLNDDEKEVLEKALTNLNRFFKHI